MERPIHSGGLAAELLSHEKDILLIGIRSTQPDQVMLPEQWIITKMEENIR